MPDGDSVESGGEDLERRFALGIGLTNECNLACAFCYRDPSRVDRLDLQQVRSTGCRFSR
jgi:MoaA/NifB/PqqE/SkfB family radical SAM enzyme